MSGELAARREDSETGDRIGGENLIQKSISDSMDHDVLFRTVPHSFSVRQVGEDLKVADRYIEAIGLCLAEIM